MVGAVAKMIVTVSTMIRSTVLQRLFTSWGTVTGLVAAYLGMVMLLQLDPTLNEADAWILSAILTPCLIGVLGGGLLLSYHGVRKWWNWVTDND